MSATPVAVVGGPRRGCGLLSGGAGTRVVVPEVADKPGGGSRPDETIPGHDLEQTVASIPAHRRADAEASCAPLHREIPLSLAAAVGVITGSSGQAAPPGLLKAQP